MGRNLDKRLSTLETVANPPGKPRVFIVGSLDHGGPPPPEQFKVELAEARAQARPGDSIIKIVYIENWRTNEPTAAKTDGVKRGFNRGHPAI